MADTITVHCLVQGDFPSSDCAYPIKIAKEKTIFDLEKIIKASIDAEKIKLWKVNIPLNTQNNKLNALKDGKDVDIETILGGEVLCPDDTIRKAFPNGLSNKCIHVIIQRFENTHTETDCAKFYDGYFKLKPEGCQRIEVALLISQAIYKEDPIKFLNRESIKDRHRFGEVCVANKNGINTPYLIAFSNKEVYIAFRGTWNVKNWVQNMSILPNFTGNRGSIHSGFKRIAEQVPLDLLTNIIENDNIKRITLCGHSYGGAVSHVYLLLYFIFCYNGGSTLQKDLDILSIAFGSPFVADHEIRKWLRERQNLANCFWTFVHKNDGIPRSLNLVDNIAEQASSIKQIHDKVNIFIETLGKIFPETITVEEFLGDAKRLFDEFSDNPVVQKSVSELYQPFGWWIFCEKNAYLTLDSSRQPDDIIEKLGKIELTVESIREHSIKEYYTVLKTVLDFTNIDYGFVDVNDIPIKMSNRFYPEISAVQVELQDSDKHKPRLVISINGKNLHFLSEPAIELTGFTSNIVHLTPAKTSSKEILMGSHFLIAEGFVGKNDSKTIKLCKLQIKSHFGTTERIIKEEEWKTKALRQADKFVNEAVKDLLHKAVQRCFINYKNGGGSNATKSLLESVIKLERIVFGQKISNVEEAFTTCLDKFDVSDGLFEIEKMTDTICSDIMMKISSEISINTGRGIYFIFSLIVIGAISSGGMAALAGAVAEGVLLSTISGGIVTGGISSMFYNKAPLLASEARYRSLVNLFLQQLKPLDNEEDAKMEESSINSPFDTEEALYNKWESFGYMNMDSNEIINNMPFREDEQGLYRKADYDSKNEAVHRIKSIVQLHDVRRKLLEHAFVTAIGPQNAGKTTSLLRLFPGIMKLPNSDTIEIGIGKHTRTPITYEFEHLSIVDFPGLNAVNEENSSAPNMKLPEKLRNTIRQCGILASVILCVFKFEGSVTVGLKELIDLVVPYLGEVPVLLCLNQAVEKMKTKDGLTDRRALNIWRDRIINELGFSEEINKKLEIEFTDFESQNAESINRGIWGTKEVMQWIRKNIRDQLSFIKKDDKIDDMLEAAINIK